MDIVERLRDQFDVYDETKLEAADEIERLRQQNEDLMRTAGVARVLINQAEEIKRLRQQNAELLEALQNIADGPRDVEKSYISLLHEVRYEARAAITKATGNE